MHLDSKDCTISPSQRNDYSTLRVNLFSSEMRSPHLVFLVGVLFCAVVNGQHPHCPDVYGLATHPHPEFCDKFFKCENGTLTLETCENGLLFDGKSGVHNHCGYNWGVQCGEGRVSDVPAISTPGCLYQFGIYPKAPGCHKTYVKCAFGVPYETHCEAGLAYDEKTHSCNWPDLLLENGCDPEEIIGYRCPDKVEPGTLAYKFWPYPRFALPNDPHRLITCVNGYPRIVNCGDTALVNPATLTCEEQEH
ncbi:protein obstructor-E [Folsomia candida]|uniref:Peritrophin-1 n=1 Tax=Folsomia candida TaxID=158441 RepID=A0A226EJT3_FOLCA|nr:protein obstructor-E [Folsomia candida]OXA57902.1 Peritrophin-1 [Folsomia candida]